MTHYRNVVSGLLLAASSVCLTSVVQAQNAELTNTAGGGASNSGGNLGSYTMANMPMMPKSYKDLEKFRKNEQAIDPKREQIIKLMQSSIDLAKEKKYEDALARLQLIEATEGKTAEEALFVQRMRVSIAATSGNQPLLAKSLEAVLDSKQLQSGEQREFTQALAELHYSQKNYAKAITWLNRYFNEGGTDATMRSQLTRAYYLSNDYVQASKAVTAEMQADATAGNIPSQEQLRILASCALKLKDQVGYISAIEKTVAYYPKKEYWVELLNNVVAKPGFPDSLSLDVYRLMLATGQLTTAREYVDMAQLALQSGYPAEAKKILADGIKSGLLGKGADAASHKRLLEVATDRSVRKLASLLKERAKYAKAADGAGLVNVGYSYVAEGQFDKGLAVIQEGVALGGSTLSQQAKLHVGIANAMAGRNAEALQVFRSINGSDGVHDLARYWAIYVARPNA